MELDAKIEGLLFYKGEPLSISSIAKILKVSKEEAEEALKTLGIKLENRGMTLTTKDDEVVLTTRPEMTPFFAEMRKEEISKELSKASVETIAIILYKNGATRSEIDYIRGVNSSFILRNLSIRGLVERKTDEKDSRRYIYLPTFDLLSFMGLSGVSTMPEYQKYKEMLEGQAEAMVINNESVTE